MKLSRPIEKRIRERLLTTGLVCVLGVISLPACLLHTHRNRDLATPVSPGDQPDKILYEKATNEIDHGRYDVGRLTLQTLINTYPDSEFLAKAKLAIADSYYKEGGVSGLTQAEAEYKDFITFFPTAPEAPEAQFRTGMAHFRLMDKPDRDRAQARQAEAEFKEFLLKYPDSPVMPRVKARLREVQEILSQSDYKVAKFYYLRGVNPAARSRFQEIADRYPNFSQCDQALWYLGQTLERLKKLNEAAPYYARIITDYPLSLRVGDAKGRLTAMHQPIPRPTQAMLARARADALRRAHTDLIGKLGGMMSSSPDFSATRHGPVRLGGPKASEVEVVKTAEPAPVTNTVTVQPVGEAALKAGKPANSNSVGNGKPADSNAANGSTPGTALDSSQGSANKSQTQQNSPPANSPDIPQKKKGRLHVLKKLNPF